MLCNTICHSLTLIYLFLLLEQWSLHDTQYIHTQSDREKREGETRTYCACSLYTTYKIYILQTRRRWLLFLHILVFTSVCVANGMESLSSSANTILSICSHSFLLFRSNGRRLLYVFAFAFACARVHTFDSGINTCVCCCFCRLSSPHGTLQLANPI